MLRLRAVSVSTVLAALGCLDPFEVNDELVGAGGAGSTVSISPNRAAGGTSAMAGRPAMAGAGSGGAPSPGDSAGGRGGSAAGATGAAGGGAAGGGAAGTRGEEDGGGVQSTPECRGDACQGGEEERENCCQAYCSIFLEVCRESGFLGSYIDPVDCAYKCDTSSGWPMGDEPTPGTIKCRYFHAGLARCEADPQRAAVHCGHAAEIPVGSGGCAE